jgi:hypothetical protein
VGIAVLALGMPADGGQRADEQSRLFFEGSVAGFLTVAGGLALLVARSNRFERTTTRLDA